MCTYGYEEGRSATAIAAMMLTMAASVNECGNDKQLHVASLDMHDAFERVTPQLLFGSLASATYPALAMAVLREQVGGRNIECFQGSRSTVWALTGPSSKEEKKVYIVQHGDALAAETS